MPTMRSTSADRSAICALSATPCARIASLNCAPIDFTGLSVFIALSITTERFFHRTAASCRSVSPTMFWPLNATLPSLMRAGGASNCAMANSRVDLPQPDSPTMPRNSLGSRSKLTLSTAPTTPRSVTYSADRSRTTSTGSLADPLDTLPPHAPDRPQGRVPDLVERVIEQRERGAKGHDAQPRHDDPQGQAGLERLVVLRPVQHRAPADLIRVAEPDELQARGEQHRVQRVGQEAGHQQRGHRGDDLHDDDVQRALAAHPRRLEEVAAAQRQRLGAQLAGRIGPRDRRDDR